LNSVTAAFNSAINGSLKAFSARILSITAVLRLVWY
jgi:hypothetical protein